jgi:Nuclease-related domain
MSSLTVQVWRRYGQLRIYVSEADRKIGWYDPRNGRFELAEEDMAPQFWAAALAECDRLISAGKLTERVLPPAGPPNQPEPSPARPTPRVTGPAPRATWPERRPAEPPAVTENGSPLTAGTSPDPGNDHWIVRDPSWDDLATSAPGAAARAHAAELRQQHPVRTVAARLVGVRTTARSFAIGAKGERMVGNKLDRWTAAAGWHVLHAVPVGERGADIDHVVIGPFGVVTVNTKATSTTVWVGEAGMKVGHTTVDYLPKSRAEGRRAAELLSAAAGWPVPVQPTIVFVGAERFTVRRGGPADVAVLPTPRALHDWLRQQPRVLDAGQVAAVYAAARQPGTWQPPRPRRG